jgi:preprotein translocase subunit YajC
VADAVRGPIRSQADAQKKNRKIVAVMNQQMVVFLPLLIVLGAFMFFASRRQKRAMQATIDLHESLRVGDRVNTTSGLQGTIKRITDDTVDLEIAAGVVTTWMKLAIRDRIEPEVLDTEAQEADDLADDPERLPKD